MSRLLVPSFGFGKGTRISILSKLRETVDSGSPAKRGLLSGNISFCGKIPNLEVVVHDIYMHQHLISMSKSEISRLRSLLTARGDFWDLRWDIEQLERAWRNEIVTIPVRYFLRLHNYPYSQYDSRTMPKTARLQARIIIIGISYPRGPQRLFRMRKSTSNQLLMLLPERLSNLWPPSDTGFI